MSMFQFKNKSDKRSETGEMLQKERQTNLTH